MLEDALETFTLNNGLSSVPITGTPDSTFATPTSQSAIGEPTVGQDRTVAVTGAAATQGGVTIDGTCGAHNGGSICENWPKGGCCSMYGYCGNTYVSFIKVKS